MLSLRKELPQGGTIDTRSKADQELYKRLESSVAYPESGVDTGITESPGDLGEIAYPQSDRMDAEEALFTKLSKATGDKGSETKSSIPAPSTPTTAVKPEPKPRRQKTRVKPPPQTGLDDTGDFGDDTGDPTFEPLTVNAQGVQINQAVIEHHGEDFSDNTLKAILDQHEKDIRASTDEDGNRTEMSEEDRKKAAEIDLENDEAAGNGIWDGDGPTQGDRADGRLSFFENPDGGPPKGYWERDDGTVQNVTGMLFPPGTN